MKKLFKTFIILIIILLTTSCSYRELNDLAIASSLGIDYEDNSYIISAEIMDVEKKEKENSQNTSIIYIGTGKTIAEAIRNISLKYPNTLYLGHLQLIIVGSGEIDHGIENTFDYFVRTSESRNDAAFLISKKNKAYEIINPNDEEKEKIPSKDIITTIENSMNRNGKAVFLNLEEFISTYLENGIDPVVTSIEKEIDINEDYKNTTLNKVAVFKDNKFIDYLKDEDTMAYNIINKNFYDININTTYENNPVSVAVFNPDSNIDIKFKNNKINVDIKIDLEGTILEIDDKVNLATTNALTKIQESIDKIVTNYVYNLIDFCKDKNVDILGLKNYIYKHYNNKYNYLKDKNIYEIANINVKTNTVIFRYGNIYKGFIRR